jgi:ADP-heptose:LPS heptosyltransferase
VRVLLVRAGALGDLLLLRRAIAALHGTGHEAWLIAPDPARALVGGGASEVRDLVHWDGAEVAALLAGTLPERGPLGRRLSRTAAAIVFSRSPDVIAAVRARVPRVLTRDPSPAHGHASLWLAEPARELGADPSPPPPDLVATAQEREDARPWLDRLGPGFLALHPGSGSATKNWPAERFLALAKRLAGGRRWLLVEGPADAAEAGALRADPRAVPASRLSVRVRGALLARAALYVGNDSGVSHLAAAFGASTLALFGPTDPAVWSPLGRRVAVVRSPDRTMPGLAMESVLSAAAALIAEA